jgi:hypothetical protein
VAGCTDLLDEKGVMNPRGKEGKLVLWLFLNGQVELARMKITNKFKSRYRMTVFGAVHEILMKLSTF